MTRVLDAELSPENANTVKSWHRISARKMTSVDPAILGTT